MEEDIRIKFPKAVISIQQGLGVMGLKTPGRQVNIKTGPNNLLDYFMETNHGFTTFLIQETLYGVLNIVTPSRDVKVEVPAAISSISRNQPSARSVKQDTPSGSLPLPEALLWSGVDTLHA